MDADALTLVGVFDTPTRDPGGRYVTVAYAVTVPEDTTAEAGDDAAAVHWLPVDQAEHLAFDHAEIVAAAAHPLA